MTNTNTKKVVARFNARLRNLRQSLALPAAMRYYTTANTREALRRVDDPTRPVVIWTYRVVLTQQQQEAFEKMSGWNILGTVHHVIDDAYALVARAADNSCYGVLYPTGELERSEKKREFDLRRGSWNTPRTQRAALAVKPSVIQGTRENCPAGPVEANGMWTSIQVFATK